MLSDYHIRMQLKRNNILYFKSRLSVTHTPRVVKHKSEIREGTFVEP